MRRSATALGRVVALATIAALSATAALAADDPRPGDPADSIEKAWQPEYGIVKLDKKRDNTSGPIELPRPVPIRPVGDGRAVALDGAKGSVPGAMPIGRSGGSFSDKAAEVERSIRQVIRKLG